MYHLDRTKKNIFIIEISESQLRDYFASLRMLAEICDSSLNANATSKTYLRNKPNVKMASFLPELAADMFFNRNINQNLQYNLFNYNFITPMFGYKAAINYYCFNRASGDVVISNDRQFLLYKGTVEDTGTGSSFSEINADEIRTIVDNLNTVYANFKAHGFNEVYLSIIPNTVSVVEPAKYNHLIQLIEKNRQLKMPVIDAYSIYENNPRAYFLAGDTHWNNKGLLLWLKTVNERLLSNTQ